MPRIYAKRQPLRLEQQEPREHDGRLSCRGNQGQVSQGLVDYNKRLEFTLSVMGSFQMALRRTVTWLCLDIAIIRQSTVTDLLAW